VTASDHRAAASRAANAWAAAAPAGLLAVAVVLTSANLRAAVASVGPVLRPLQADLGMSDTVAGVLTTLPVLCFGIVGLLSARLARRTDPATALVGALVLIAVGTGVRALAPRAISLLLASLLALVGIAVGNVLVPVAIKAWFRDDVGRMTGWYSTAISVGTAIPAATTVPIATAAGSWRMGLAAWTVPALLALVPWLLAGRAAGRASGRRDAERPGAGSAASDDGPAATTGASDDGPDATTGGPDDGPDATTGGPDADAPDPAPDPERVAEVMRAVRRHPQAWALTAFFGFQSLEAYVALGWLAAILQDAGVSPSRAGVLLAVTMGLGAPVSLVLPRLAARSPDQRPYVVGLLVCSLVAYLGLLLAPAAAPTLWAISLGIGLGAFPLALVLLGLRARSSAGTAALSSLAQGGGYLLAATGPVAVGALHDLTGGWTVPLSVLLALLVPKLIVGLLAAAPGSVDAEVLARPPR
jgi:CP family cyanate transporter-like MFS transporter